MNIQTNTINSGESGAVARAKINSLFSALIEGTEGINRVWSQIKELAASTETLGENLEEVDQKVVKTTQDLVTYTNKEVYDLLQYINALKSNTPGLIPGTSYNPQVALEDSAAFIAVGPGTFTYFKDSSNQPITISEDSAINIFYKEAGVSYYTYKGIVVPSPSAGYQFMGVVPSLDYDPGEPHQKVFYIASVSGIYSNFGNIAIENEIAILAYDTTWHKLSTGIANEDYVYQNLIGIKGKIFEKNLAGEYDTIKSNAHIPAGVFIMNEGVRLILATDSNLTNRIDLGENKYFLTTHELNLIRTANTAGNARLRVLGKLDSMEGEYKPFMAPEVTIVNESAQYIYGLSIKKNEQFGIYINSTTTGRIVVSNEDVSVRFLDGSNKNNQLLLIQPSFDLPVLRVANLSGNAATWQVTIFRFTSLDVEQLKKEFALPITTSRIKDKAVTITKVDFSSSKNLIDNNTLHIGHYWNYSGGGYSTNSIYDATEKIPIKPGTPYILSGSGYDEGRFIDLYKADRSPSRRLEHVNSFITNDDEDFVIISLYATTSKHYQLEEGTVATEYMPYAFFIDKDVLPKVTTDDIKDGNITQAKLASDIVLPPAPSPFKSFMNSIVVEAGNTIGIGGNGHVNIWKNILLAARIDGTIQEILMGVGKNDYYGKWLRLDNTNLIVYNRNGIEDTYSHGLTLTESTLLMLSGDFGGTSHVDILTDTGEKFSQSISWGLNVGTIFFENANTTGSLNVTFSFTPRDITKKIWLFGDSYFSFIGDPRRWPYYMVQWNYTDWLMNSIGGENAQNALLDLQNLMTLGFKPSYIVWCMGMNGADDQNGAVNVNWENATETMLSICQENGIVPILATIPSVPERIHTELNEYVRARGKRYIDFAKAVEENGSYYWKGWGTDDALLSNDKVHPSTKGAISLAMAVISDFPEISIKD